MQLMVDCHKKMFPLTPSGHCRLMRMETLCLLLSLCDPKVHIMGYFSVRQMNECTCEGILGIKINRDSSTLCVAFSKIM